MIALALYVASLVSPPSSPACEEFGPRLDGTYVTVCDGSVVRVRDGASNNRVWEHATNTVIVRSPQKATMVLGFDGR